VIGPYMAGRVDQTLTPAVAPLPNVRFDEPARYIASEGAARAVNVAILLGQPLLVTGEPGTGKTQLARSVAWQLGLGEPRLFETKSTTVARELFYAYDALGRFQDKEKRPVRDFIRYRALGEALLLTNPIDRIADLLPPGFVHDGPKRSVVLIDEIDKAPRDFPNDILNEIEAMYFRIPEFHDTSKRGAPKIAVADPALRPIVIITSNSEKNLPDAFLRRCVYYDIPFPSSDDLWLIIESRLPELAASGRRWITDAIDLFLDLRSEPTMDKKPATAELLSWIVALHLLGVQAGQPLRGQGSLLDASLGVIIKSTNDSVTAQKVIGAWSGQP